MLSTQMTEGLTCALTPVTVDDPEALPTPSLVARPVTVDVPELEPTALAVLAPEPVALPAPADDPAPPARVAPVAAADATP
jgi:hypothetical protein